MQWLFYSIFKTVLNRFSSASSAEERTSLLSYLDFRNSTRLCSGYLDSMALISTPALSSFRTNGLFWGNSLFSLLGIFLMRASSAAIFSGKTVGADEAFWYRPSSCFFVSQPRAWYCLYRLMINEETGYAMMHSSSTILMISTLCLCFSTW
jgi:hypothetical protein